MAKLQQNRQVSSRDKVEAILRGALQEFLASGYSGASMDRITAAAGVSKSTLYAHFKDKESLFTALIQRIADDKLRVIFSLQDLEGQAQDPAQVLRQIAQMMVAKVTQDPQMIALMRLLMFETGRFPSLGETFVESVEKPAFEALTQYLASCPNLRLSDPEAAARIFLGSLVHFVLTQEGLNGKTLMPMDPDRLIESLIQSLLFSGPDSQS